MANQPSSGTSYVVNADGTTTLIVHGQTLDYNFRYVGAPPVQKSDLDALRDEILGAIKGMMTTALSTGTVSVPGQQPPAQQPPAAQPPAQQPPAQQPPTATQPGTDATGAILVGPNRPITEIADAIAKAQPNGLIIVDDATYLKAFHTAVPGLTIKSASGNPRKCRMDGQRGAGGGHVMAWQKAMIHVGDVTTIQGIGFVNCGSPESGQNYSNEAAIYAEQFPAPGGLLHVIGCTFDNNANGIFVPEAGNGGENVDLLSENNVFGRDKPNGQNCAANPDASKRVSGPAHDHYVNGRSVEVTGAYCYGNPGHSVKSRSPKTYIHDCPLLTGWGGRAVEATLGGSLTIKNSTLVQRGDGDPSGTGLYGNTNLLAYGDEGTTKGLSDPTMDGCTLHVARLSTIVSVAAGATLKVANTLVHYYGQGSLIIQGNATGLQEGSATPGDPASYTLPTAPL